MRKTITMSPEENLLDAVRNGAQANVQKLLDEGVDFRYGNDAALREAALLKSQSIAKVLLRKYMADGAGKEAGNIAQNLIESAEFLQRWHVRVALRGPDVEPEL